MKVRCIKRYSDVKLKKIIEVDTIFDVDEERAQHLVRISGKYEVKPDEKGRMHYILENGTDIQESDGICLFAGKDEKPDYRIISIKPYRILSLEVEKI